MPGPDRRLEVLARWADEDPEAMSWLLSDPVLQKLLASSLRRRCALPPRQERQRDAQ